MYEVEISGFFNDLVVSHYVFLEAVLQEGMWSIYCQVFYLPRLLTSQEKINREAQELWHSPTLGSCGRLGSKSQGGGWGNKSQESFLSQWRKAEENPTL